MPASQPRIRALDALRGFFLVLMTVTHLPTRARVYSHDLFGFVSAAEGFVFLSAFLVGAIYSARAREDGWAQAQRLMLRRAAKLYAIHLGLMVFAFATAALCMERPAFRSMYAFLLDEPYKALVAAPLLVYCPQFFDILPMYILFMACSPFALRLGAQRGLGAVLGLSGLLWGAAQLGAREPLQHAVSALLGGIPSSAFGAFDLLGWQFMWALGLCVGASPKAQAALTRPLPLPALLGACAVCVTFFLMRHGELLFGVTVDAPYVLDKWRLAPMRLLNMYCLAVVFIHLGPVLLRAGGSLFALLGRASLRVFCAHLVFCLLSCLLIDDLELGLPFELELVVMAGTFVSLLTLASLHPKNKGFAPASRVPST
jgi:hypothetical protein